MAPYRLRIGAMQIAKYRPWELASRSMEGDEPMFVRAVVVQIRQDEKELHAMQVKQSLPCGPSWKPKGGIGSQLARVLRITVRA